MIAARQVASKIIASGPSALPVQAPRSGAEVIQALRAEERAAVESLINKLFQEIRSARTAWRQAWPTVAVVDAAKVTWTLALIEGGVRDWDRQVEYGLRRLRAEPSDFVPAPGKFVEWCSPRPEDLGLQPAERAFEEACRNAHPSYRAKASWSHTVTYHAAIAVGLDVFGELSGAESWRLFERSYALMTRRAISGQPLGDAVPLGLTHDGHKTAVELAEERSLQQAMRIREIQGVTQSGPAAREALLASVRRRRSGGVA